MEALENIVREITSFVTDSRGRVFETRNVYVADSSLFPAAPGVNPSWTIMALARHVALNIPGEQRN